MKPIIMKAKSREEYVYFAKIAESVDQYAGEQTLLHTSTFLIIDGLPNSEMVEYVKEIVRFAHARLTPEERSLLSVAYKNLTGQLRNGWRVVSQIEDVEKTRSVPPHREVQLAQRERQVIEKDILDACLDILKLLDSTLIPAARPGDETVFYYKM